MARKYQKYLRIRNIECEEMVNRAAEAISLRKQDRNQAIKLEKYFSQPSLKIYQ